MMVALAILMAIGSVCFALFRQYSERYRMATEVSTSTSSVQLALNQMLQEMRLAGYPSTSLVGATGAVGFTSIQPTSVSFESALDPSQTTVYTVTYTLSGNALLRTIAPKGSPAGNPVTLATGIDSLQFTYLDQNNQPTPSPAQVCRVLVTVTAQTGAGHASGPSATIPMQGSAYARNLCHLNPGA